MHCVKYHSSWRLNDCQLFYQIISTSCVGCCIQFGNEGSLKNNSGVVMVELKTPGLIKFRYGH